MIIRTQGVALFYGRRSGRRQELSLSMQLNWAISEAARRGLALNAREEDLQYMQENRLNNFKSIRLDNTSGSDLERPGFLSLIQDALHDGSVSHVLIHKRDRFARPQEAVEMVQVEKRLSHAGITLVFSDGVTEPYHPGQGGLEQDIMTLLAYSESGNYLNQLAERVILAHTPLARNNYSTGGSAVYGFVRALFDPSGNFVEFLPKGRTVRQQGYHVRWVPGEDDESQAKIRTWIYILDLKHKGWGGKRIANHLNKLGIPSPGAGTTRTDHGVPHVVSGKWGHNSVIDLCKNATILGIKQYGRRSEGKHRRLGEDGWRMLNGNDLSASGKPKFINNESSLIVQGRGTSPDLYDEDTWRDIQADMKQRGRNQSGVSRVTDESKYPLRCRVVDMTDNCGAIMYGTQQSKRRLYKCGRYMRTAGDECDNNSVDAEALLRFVLRVLAQQISQRSHREELRNKLLEVAQRQVLSNESNAGETDLLTIRLRELKEELEAVQHNLAREKDESLYSALRKEYLGISERIEEVEHRLKSNNARSLPSGELKAENEVESALLLFDDIARLTTDPTARSEIGEMLKRLGCRVGLNFVEAIKGKKRRVRKLAGGIVVFGNAELPVALHGRNRVEDPKTTPIADTEGREPSDCAASSKEEKNVMGRGNSESVEDCVKTHSLTDARPGQNHREGISLTKVSRGDWI